MIIRNNVIQAGLRILAADKTAKLYQVASHLNMNTDEREAFACQHQDWQEALNNESAEVDAAEENINKQIFGNSGH